MSQFDAVITETIGKARRWAAKIDVKPISLTADDSHALTVCLCQMEHLIKELTDDRDAYARAALAGLAGLVPTPERGYVEDGGPAQLEADFKVLREMGGRLRTENVQLKDQNDSMIRQRVENARRYGHP